MGFTSPFTTPFYSGGGISADVPGKWDCALNGRTYMYDWKNTYVGVTRLSRQSISLLKPQQDNSGNVSEQSLNPEEFARRSGESWHHGAGQTWHDRQGSNSDAFRFRSSKGLDVWTKNHLTLLPDTTLIRASIQPNLALVPVGGYLYVADGNEVYFTLDATAEPVDWTPASIFNGETAEPVHDICSDGGTVYAALGAAGVHSTVRGATTSVHMNDLAATLVGYVKGRLIAVVANSVFNITDATSVTAPSALLEHPNVDFTWVAITEGPGQIYLAGFSGDKSLIYRTAILPDGTDLDTPIVAGALPDGEVIRSLVGYEGFLIAGTDQGLRLIQLNTAGNMVSMSRIIPTTSAVLCLEAQGDFIYYGLTNYDSISTGLGRASLRDEDFTATLTPAYASDLMAATQGVVGSVATFQGRRVFAVDGAGLYFEATDLVASGVLEQGLVGFDLPDLKVAMNLDVRFSPLAGTVAIALSSDGGPFITVGTTMAEGITSLIVPAGQSRAETFEPRLTLTRSADADTAGPTVTRWTIEANPAPGRGETYFAALRLFESVDTANGNPEKVDVAAELQALLSMEALGMPVTHQDALGASTVFLDDHQFIIDSYNKNRDGYNGIFVAQLRRPRQRS